MEQNYLDVKAKFIRGFSDKTRLQILECIKNGEKTVSQIVEELQGNQSNISQHLACLKGCGIIVGRQEGKFVYYSLRNEKIKEMLELFDEVLNQVQTEVAQCDSHLY
ncbi:MULTISPECIES: ArsR/SmtB family transcription factor [Anoxybacillaceae]|jgi:DNA-binding transcriptional ArsR family regulator|uniref:Winged helix-turn-helix transcriptional regulator n=1 Tax=Parageobacillus thermoglucosidasius TaxID=1426 RepID=A0AB38QZ49_PARTM|nr:MULTISPECIES: metalloregulator ArsR/SmtB family transcription factor [Bacillaceae]MEC5188775.1 ArsR family transcriptional regulator [Geobacillus thermodenitrificans]QSB48722.1 winged helix-turn-helix transcriptional regulator [Parageobacillus toebii]UOE76897.1 winged helix-turn-helix transcriptional regulator [Parageobacillus thermoglucosidasius]